MHATRQPRALDGAAHLVSFRQPLKRMLAERNQLVDDRPALGGDHEAGDDERDAGQRDQQRPHGCDRAAPPSDEGADDEEHEEDVASERAGDEHDPPGEHSVGPPPAQLSESPRRGPRRPTG